MLRSHPLRWAAFSPTALIMLFLAAGCGHSVRNAAAPPAPVATAAPASPAPAAAFQPYTLLPPPPAPPVAAPRHRVLHLTLLHDHVYLADSDRHLYEAGRDRQGHIYPIYRDPATRVTYPLYYDARRDNLYRLAREDGGHFYRNYVGEGRTRFYESDRDYERITPSDADRPVVTDSYNTYNDYAYNHGPNYGAGYPNNNAYRPHYAGYRPPPHHSSHNDNWLWAVPVIIGAYLLLQPRHHSAPPARSRPTTVIVRQSTPITIINQITQAAPIGYRPIASPRPVSVYPPRYTAQPGYASAPGYASRNLRPHGSISPVAAAPLAIPGTHTALVPPAARPALASIAARPTSPSVPHAAVRPLARLVPLVRHAAPVAPRTVRRSHAERPRMIAPPAPRSVLRRVEAARPRPTARPRPVAKPHVVERPRVVRVPSPAVRPSVSTRPRPGMEPRRLSMPPAPHIERPASAPRRPVPTRLAAARPHPAHLAPPVQAREERKKPEAPRRMDKPKARPKPSRH